MASMSFAGISTGIPTDQMIEAMLANERLPINRLQSRQTTNNQKKTALQVMKTAFSNLATSVASLTSAKLSGRTVSSSDSSAMTATASGGASGSYDVVVRQLATKARAEVSNSFGSPTDSVGSAGDSYTIVGKNGAETKITLEDGKTSLADLSAAINAKSGETGVSANIVQKKPGEYHMVLSSTETGAGTDGRDTIGIYGESGNALGVGTALDGDGNIAGINVTERAKNAVFTLDGVEMERSTNTVSDAVDGVTFTLNKAENKTVTLKVAMDTSSIVSAFQDVISKYNTAMQSYKNNSGVFSGDATMRTIFTQLRSSISGAVQGGDGDMWSSAVLGLTTGRDGTLSLDTKKLEESLQSNPEAVGKVFDKMSKDSKTFIDGLTTSGGGTITNLISSIDTANTNLSKQIETIQARLDRRKETLTAEFARLETLIGQMQSAGQSLSGLSS
ncbi:MAG: flagellar filament capping protein FliD [Holophagales bacterium]|jgi:flagellar hook-associated protein 2|nr:flagellar filament capping protein FliD [Holophagales bacterium]